jgi:hypothetical protein
LENDENLPAKSKKQKTFGKKLIFVGVLKVTEEKRRIRSQIWRIRRSGSIPKCHGSKTLKESVGI